MDLAATALVGRDRELQLVLDRCERALAGHPGLLVVSGAAHVGTTSLICEATARLRRAHSPAPKVVNVVALPWEREQEGELAQRLCAVRGVGSPVPVDDADPTRSLARALVERLRDGSASGLVIVVEDAHHADAVSLRALSSAVHRLHDEPVAVILQVSDPDSTDPALSTVLRAHRADSLNVDGLQADAIQELARSRGQSLSPDAARRLASYTAGLPGLVIELLEEYPARLWETTSGRLPAPRSVRQEISAVLGDSSPEVSDLVKALAVCRSGADVSQVAELVNLDDPLPAIDEARSRGLVDVVTTHGQLVLAFTSPMLGAAAYDAVDLVQREQLHRAAAEQATDEYTRLQHLAEATTGPDAGLAESIADLARSYAARGQWSLAGDCWVLASRAHPDRSRAQEYLVDAVDAITSAGDLHLAEALGREVEAFPPSPRRDGTLGYLSLLKGRRGQAHQLLHHAFEQVRDRGDAAEATLAHRLALHGLADFDGQAMVDVVGRSLEVGDAIGSPTMPAVIEAHTLHALSQGMVGQYQAAEEAHQAALSLLENGAQRQRALMGHGWLELAIDRPQQAAQDLQAAIPQAYWQGSSRVALWASGWLARALLELGDWESAMGVVHRAQEMLDHTGMDLIAPLVHWTGAEISALRGESSQADWHIAQCLAVSSDYMIMKLPTAIARSMVAHTRADNDAALHALEPIATQPRPCSVDEPGFWPWHDLWASSLVLGGRIEEAEAFLAPREEQAREAGRHATMARLGMARGRLLSVSGDIEAARDQFAQSLELLEDMPYVYLRTRVNYLYGQALRRAGKRRDAGVVLRRALDGFSAMGAEAYVERCRRELQAGGASGSRSSTFAVESLTPQEQAVARLVAQGLSNADVARELFISVKTVQFHLTRVYSKLGLRSRTELAAHRAELADSED